jgi:hypothetical protein
MIPVVSFCPLFPRLTRFLANPTHATFSKRGLKSWGHKQTESSWPDLDVYGQGSSLVTICLQGYTLADRHTLASAPVHRSLLTA